MKIHFVYNANSNPIALATDFLTRLFDHDNYTCNLCDLTYNTLTRKKEWSTFIKSLHAETIFHTKDLFQKMHPNTNRKYPVIIKEENGILTEIVSAEMLNRFTTVEEIIEAVKAAI